MGTAKCAVFILALARPELLARRHDLGGRRTTVVRLDPLDDTAMGRLLDGLVEGLPAPTRTALIARAEGVPLFAVETIRALIDRDAVIPRGGATSPLTESRSTSTPSGPPPRCRHSSRHAWMPSARPSGGS